jgi:hypothetical protein
MNWLLHEFLLIASIGNSHRVFFVVFILFSQLKRIASQEHPSVIDAFVVEAFCSQPFQSILEKIIMNTEQMWFLLGLKTWSRQPALVTG